MTTFKKYMAAKNKVNEQQVPATMNQNYFIRKELNEYDGEAVTKGGEIDAIVFGALALIGRTMKNAITYAKLKSIKGPYLEQYELCGVSGSSRTVFDEEEQGKNIAAIKDKEIALKTKREEIPDLLAKKKDQLPENMPQEVKTKKTAAIDAQGEILTAKLDNEIDKLKTAKAKIKDAADNKWDQETRKLNALTDKIQNTEGGFVLGGTFKARWENELKQAKLNVDEEVTQKARAIKTGNGETDAAKEFEAKLARLKEKEADAEAAASELESNEDEESAIEALEKIPSLPAYQSAKEDLDSKCGELEKTYGPEAEKEKEEEPAKSEEPANSTSKKKKTEESNNVLEEDESKAKVPSPSAVIALMSKAYENQPDDIKPDFAAKVISNIETLRELKVLVAQKRLATAEEVATVAAEEDSKLDSKIKGAFLQDGKVPENFKEDAKEASTAYEEELNSWKEKADGKSDNEETEGKGEEETKSDDKKIELAEQEVDTAKSDVDTAKGEKEKSDEGDDEAAKIDAEINVVKSEIKWRQAKQKVAKLKGDDEQYQGFGDDIGKDMEKIQSLEQKKKDLEKDKGAKEETEDKSDNKESDKIQSEIDKNQKDITQKEKEYDEMDRSGDKGYAKGLAIRTEISDLKDKNTELRDKKVEAQKKEELESAPKKESKAPKESIASNIPSKFMKFEDYLLAKQKNI